MNNSDNNEEQDDFLAELAKSFSIKFPEVANEDSENEEMWDDEDERALTAPARPLTDIEEFRRSNNFRDLE